MFIENLDEIKSKLDPEQVLDFIQPGKKKNRRGNELRTPCPVHDGDGAENFAINLSTHEWFCHSQQCKGSNLIDLYAQSRKIPLPEAASELANQFGIKINYRKSREFSSEKYTPEDVLRCWNEAKIQGKDTYFSKKNLSPPPIARFGKNPGGYESTLIPLKDIEGSLKGILSLNSGGKFNFKTTETLIGAFALLGEIHPEGEFYIGEGIATVQTAWESTQRIIPAISCGTWSNLEPVLSALKTKYPNNNPVVLIDCDEGGRGLEAARIISAKFQTAKFKKPSFESFLNPNNEKITDFNDIISKCGQSIDEVRRQLLIDFDLSTAKIYSKEPSANQTIIQKATNGSKNHGKCEIAGDVLKKIGFLERIKNRKLEYDKNQIVKLSGIPTNFSQLDGIIDGLQGGHLIILAGRTGMGKTFLALNMLKNIAIDQKIPAALYSLEMSNSQVFYRLVSLCSGIPSTKIKRGTINDKELHLVESAVKLIENSPLFVTDEPTNSVLSTLSSNIHSSCKAMEVKAIFIDHIGLVSCGNNYKDNRANEMGKITMTVKIAAKQYDIPIICLAQLNREADAKERPKLSHLRESGNLEQDSDIVLFIHRRNYYDKNDKPEQAEIIVEKNREGETGIVTFKYEPNTWLLQEFPPLENKIQAPKGHIYP